LDLSPWHGFPNTDDGGSEHPTTFQKNGIEKCRSFEERKRGEEKEKEKE
jgi:hypothetical protein